MYSYRWLEFIRSEQYSEVVGIGKWVEVVAYEGWVLEELEKVESQRQG